MKKISVVIPTFQRPALLLRCLHAVSKQELPADEFEVLVVNDGHDRATALTLEPFLARHHNFFYFDMPEKKGPAAARNFGWRKAEADLIAFTDDDTIPGRFWLTHFCLAHQGEREIAYSGVTIVPLPDEPTDYEKNTAGLEHAEFVTANCCCTRAALESVNGFDERFFMAWREDSDLQFNLLRHGIPVVQLTNAVVEHPVRKAQWGVSVKEQKKGMFNALLYKKYPMLYRLKIQGKPMWNYYAMVVLGLTMTIAVIFDLQLTGAIAFTGWMALLLAFIIRRLRHTSRSLKHVIEMIITSICIPFVSVYWQIYGAWKYRVFFL